MADETEEAWMDEEEWPEEPEEKPELAADIAAKDELDEIPDFGALDGGGEPRAKQESKAEEELDHDGFVSPGLRETKLAPKRVKEPEQKDFDAGYDPTSPAEDEPENVTDHAMATEDAFADTTHVAPVVGERMARSLPAQPAAPRQREEKVVPCPILLVGSQLTKECLLKPGRWTDVGRHPKATILMQNAGVSKRHCKLQWKHGSRSVELRVLDGVTHVNDKRLNSGSTMALKHGDLIKVNGKGVSFRLLLNMKPVNSSLPDVRDMESFAAACKEALPAARSPEEELQRKIRKLRAAATKKRESAVAYEERLVGIQTKIALRSQTTKVEADKIHGIEVEHEKLEALLVKSRDEWLDRLQQASELQDKAIAPLNETTATTQTKLDSLKHMKDTYDRQVHPERHIQVASLKQPEESVSPQKASPSKFAEKAGEADGEDEAFADAPARGLGVHAVKDEKFAKPTVEVLSKAPVNSDIADLFGDFDSDEEEEVEAKRQRVE